MFGTYCKRFLLLMGAVAVTGACILSTDDVQAQKFRHQFLNPAFGGHPNNYHFLITSAERQKRDFSDGTVDQFRRNPMDDFQQTMQRQMLSQLSRQLVRGDGRDFDFSKEGIYDLGDFMIHVTPGLDVISIEIVDELSGDRTHVEVPRF